MLLHFFSPRCLARCFSLIFSLIRHARAATAAAAFSLIILSFADERAAYADAAVALDFFITPIRYMLMPSSLRYVGFRQLLFLRLT